MQFGTGNKIQMWIALEKLHTLPVFSCGLNRSVVISCDYLYTRRKRLLIWLMWVLSGAWRGEVKAGDPEGILCYICCSIPYMLLATKCKKQVCASGGACGANASILRYHIISSSLLEVSSLSKINGSWKLSLSTYLHLMCGARVRNRTMWILARMSPALPKTLSTS